MTDSENVIVLRELLLGPVAPGERISAIDTLRGVALFGILTMNISMFAFPAIGYFSPMEFGGATGLNLVVWILTNVFSNLKFMAIFSMLFGAGFLIMSERASKRDIAVGPFYYRRVFWLLIIGMLHGYLIWRGDILMPYAVCGMIIFLFRKLSAKKLIISAVIALSIGLLLTLASTMFFSFARSQHDKYEKTIAVGDNPEDIQKEMFDTWNEIKSEMFFSDKIIEKELKTYRGNYLDILSYRVPEVIRMQTTAIPFYLIWRVGGLMLLGMALLRKRILSGERTRRFYQNLMFYGYGFGLILTAYDTYFLYSHDFDPIFLMGTPFNYIGSIGVALGHIGLVMYICKCGWLKNLTGRLAAVGRMALTNYLMQSVICTFFFYGYGLGFYADLDRKTIFLVVFGVWLLQLIYSPLWLKYFRFGPAEWVWRSLTYWHRQPFRKTV